MVDPLSLVERDENGPVADWNQVRGQVKVGITVGLLERTYIVCSLSQSRVEEGSSS